MTCKINSSGTYIGGRELDMIVPLGVVTLEAPERPRTEDVRIMRWPLRGTCLDTPPIQKLGTKRKIYYFTNNGLRFNKKKAF